MEELKAKHAYLQRRREKRRKAFQESNLIVIFKTCEICFAKVEFICRYYGSHLRCCSTCGTNFRFFSIGKRQEEPCPANGKCRLYLCHTCRYKKCLAAGMQTARVSKNGECTKMVAEQEKNKENVAADESRLEAHSPTHNNDSTPVIPNENINDNSDGIISISSDDNCAHQDENVAGAVNLPTFCENTLGNDVGVVESNDLAEKSQSSKDVYDEDFHKDKFPGQGGLNRAVENQKFFKVDEIPSTSAEPLQRPIENSHQQATTLKLKAGKQEIGGSVTSSLEILLKKVMQRRDELSKFTDLLQGFKKQLGNLEQELVVEKSKKMKLSITVCEQMGEKTNKLLSRLDKFSNMISHLSNNDQLGLLEEDKVLIEELSLRLSGLKQKAQNRIEDLKATLDRLQLFAVALDQASQRIVNVENQLIQFEPVDLNVEPLQKLQMDLETFNATIESLGELIKHLFLFGHCVIDQQQNSTLPTAQLDLDITRAENLKERFKELSAAANNRLENIQKAKDLAKSIASERARFDEKRCQSADHAL